MTCPGCEAEVPNSYLGPWCDSCGGLMVRPGVLLLRHVATVDGPGGRYPIVFDLSCQDYSCTIPVPPPNYNPGELDEDGFHPPPLTTYRAPSLDAIIALMQPIASGPKGPDGLPPPMPELSAAPSATPRERAVILM